MDYRSLKFKDVVPIAGDLSKAINLLAPHVAHVTHATVISCGNGLATAVLSVGDLVAVKANASLNEGKNLQYVLDHTSLPVPNLFGVHKEDGGTRFLVMELVKGEPANKAWPSLTSAQKQCITERLKESFQELRGMSADYIGAPGFRPLSSDYLNPPNLGPFRHEDELNDALVNSIQRGPNHNAVFIRKMLKSGHENVFSHGDLQLKNIMIHEGKLSGIVDWEFAGFYPEYWEYATAYAACTWTIPDVVDWSECVQRFLKPFPVEAATLKTMGDISIYGL